jgi:hypothetical protein
METTVRFIYNGQIFLVTAWSAGGLYVRRAGGSGGLSWGTPEFEKLYADAVVQCEEQLKQIKRARFAED